MQQKQCDRSKFIIPDLIVTDERACERWAIDVTGLYGESNSYLPKQSIGEWSAEGLRGNVMDVLRARDKRKDVHYDALTAIGEAEVIPFTFESHGGLSERAEQFITDIT